MGSFRDVLVYRRSVVLADGVREAVVGWSSFDRWTVGVQLVRSADSVGANLSEAAGRWHRPDRRRLVFVARGSAFETEHWLDRAETRGLPLPPDARVRAAEISRLLNALARPLTTDEPTN